MVLAVAFLAGASLMALEIVGGRIVAARFGSHVFVWGGLIGIFMGALSVGYFLGGRLSDRFPSFQAMGGVLLVAGAGVLAVSLVCDPLCEWMGNRFFAHNARLANRWNPTLAILLIFSGPALCLGSVAPFTVRLLAKELGTMGRVTGRVYALNALGSIFGTLVTAFFLMGVMGNRSILLSLGVLVLLLAVVVMGGGRFLRQGGLEHFR